MNGWVGIWSVQIRVRSHTASARMFIPDCFLQRLRIVWPCSSSVLRTGQGWIVERSSSTRHSQPQRKPTSYKSNQSPTNAPSFSRGVSRLPQTLLFRLLHKAWRGIPLCTPQNSVNPTQFKNPSPFFLHHIYLSPFRECYHFNQSQDPVPNKNFEQHRFHALSFCRTHQNSCISIHTTIYSPEHFMNNFVHPARTSVPSIDPAAPSIFLSPYK